MQDKPGLPPSCPQWSALHTAAWESGRPNWGPVLIACHLHIDISSVHPIRHRYHFPPLGSRTEAPYSGPPETCPPLGIRMAQGIDPHRCEAARHDPRRWRHRSIGAYGRRGQRPQSRQGARKNRGHLRVHTFIRRTVDDHSCYVSSEKSSSTGPKKTLRGVHAQRYRPVGRPRWADPAGCSSTTALLLSVLMLC